MEVDQHIISGTFSNVQGSTMCRRYFLVFRVEGSGIAIILFLDLTIYCFIKMECKRLALKITTQVPWNKEKYQIVWYILLSHDLDNNVWEHLNQETCTCINHCPHCTILKKTFCCDFCISYFHEKNLTTGGKSSLRIYIVQSFQMFINFFMPLDYTNSRLHIQWQITGCLQAMAQVNIGFIRYQTW